MQRLEVSCAIRPIYGSLGVKRLKKDQLDALFIFSIQLIDLHVSTTDFIYIT